MRLASLALVVAVVLAAAAAAAVVVASEPAGGAYSPPQRGDHDCAFDAREAFRKAVGVHENKQAESEDESDDDVTIGIYRRIIACFPSFAMPYNNLALAYADAGRVEAAQGALRHGLAAADSGDQHGRGLVSINLAGMLSKAAKAGEIPEDERDRLESEALDLNLAVPPEHRNHRVAVYNAVVQTIQRHPPASPRDLDRLEAAVMAAAANHATAHPMAHAATARLMNFRGRPDDAVSAWDRIFGGGAGGLDGDGDDRFVVAAIKCLPCALTIALHAIDPGRASLTKRPKDKMWLRWLPIRSSPPLLSPALPP